MNRTDFLNNFKETTTLFIQGPIGPFFNYLSSFLEDNVQCNCLHLNLNYGDKHFNPPQKSYDFKGDIADFYTFLSNFVKHHHIDNIVVFGDGRAYHVIAKSVCNNLSISFFAFEEGYIRPNYITFERNGVNGYSSIPSSPDFYLKQDLLTNTQKEITPPNVFFHMSKNAIIYYIYSIFGKSAFPKYIHHRPLNVSEAFKWVKSFFKKPIFKIYDSITLSKLGDNNYFLVPLQVHNDKQVILHSRFDGVPNFISEVISSFSKHNNGTDFLLFKHHPLDKPYCDYYKFIQQEASKYGVEERVLYIYEGHLPSLIEGANGVVIINSTVGLSSLYHNKPTISLGRSVYNFKGLTYQGKLNDFWSDYIYNHPNTELFIKFRNYLIFNNQINGSFYSKMNNTDYISFSSN